MLDKDKIEMKTLMESAAVADYLARLAEGFKSGVIVVEKDGESLTLNPAETAEVEMEARVKKDKARFSLEVSWRTAEAFDEPDSLKISAAASEPATGFEPVGGRKAEAEPCQRRDEAKPCCGKAEGESAGKHPAKPEADFKEASKAEAAKSEAVEKKPGPARTPAVAAPHASKPATPGVSRPAGK